MEIDKHIDEVTVPCEAEVMTEPRQLRAAPRGMTLVEIMVVIGIIGTITVVLATGVLSSSDKADENAARLLLSNWSTQLDMYASRSGDRKYPDNLSAIVESGSMGEDQTKDPWGTPLAYSTSGRNFELCSGGPDGSIGGGDDICKQSSRR